jgi:hypothetical protein
MLEDLVWFLIKFDHNVSKIIFNIVLHQRNFLYYSKWPVENSLFFSKEWSKTLQRRIWLYLILTSSVWIPTKVLNFVHRSQWDTIVLKPKNRQMLAHALKFNKTPAENISLMRHLWWSFWWFVLKQRECKECLKTVSCKTTTVFSNSVSWQTNAMLSCIMKPQDQQNIMLWRTKITLYSLNSNKANNFAGKKNKFYIRKKSNYPNSDWSSNPSVIWGTKVRLDKEY